VACGLFRAAVGDRDAAENVIRAGLCVFDLHVEVSVAFEHTGIHQFILEIARAAFSVLGHQVGIRELGLGVLVKHSQVTVGWGAVQVKVILLDVLSMISFGAGQPEHSLFEDRVPSVPQRQSETDILEAVANAGYSVKGRGNADGFSSYDRICHCLAAFASSWVI